MGNLNIKVIIILMFAYSCQSRGPVDNSKLQKVIEKPTKSKLTGAWEVDSFSYDFISKAYDMNNNRIILTLNNDNTFEVINMPFYDHFGTPKSKELSDVTGLWELKQSFKKNWELKLKFVDGEKQNSLSFILFNKLNKDLRLWYYIGDPDSGNRLMFTKTVE